MIHVKFDTETFPFAPGCMAPRLVCVQWETTGQETFLARAGRGDCIVRRDDGAIAPLPNVAAFDLESVVEEWLADPEVTLVGHTLDYDTAVICANFPRLIPAVFAKYEAGLCRCTMVQQQLLDIAVGKFRGEFSHDGNWRTHNYTLDDLYRRLCGRSLDKPKMLETADGRKFADPKHVRVRYGEMIDVPLSQWPQEFVEYALEDAVATSAVFDAQEPNAAWMPDRATQAYTAFCLRLVANWGVLTDGEGVNILEAHSMRAVEQAVEVLAPLGIVRMKGGKWTRDMAKAKSAMVQACARLGREASTVQRKNKATGQWEDTGNVSLDKDACGAVDDPVVEAYAKFSSENYVLSNEIPMLRAGIGMPIHCRYSVAKSGRQLASKPNVQNRSKRAGAREAFVPTAGNVFIDADYVGLELHSLAQLCLDLFGHSVLATVLNSGKDAHTAAASDMMGIAYEEGIRRKRADDAEFNRYRNYWKVLHFGLPGGLGVKALIAYAWSNYGIRFGATSEEAEAIGDDLKKSYLSRYPEVVELFNYVRDIVNRDDFFVLPRSGRILKAEFFTKTCNNGFQGSGADAALSGTRLVLRRCYAEPRHVLYGARPVIFAHDENLLETADDDTLTERLNALESTMREGADLMLPDVPTRVEGAAMRCWSKHAKRIEVNGRVVPWVSAA